MDVIELPEAVVEVPLVVIMSVRFGIGGARPQFGIDQAFVIAGHAGDLSDPGLTRRIRKPHLYAYA